MNKRYENARKKRKLVNQLCELNDSGIFRRVWNISDFKEKVGTIKVSK